MKDGDVIDLTEEYQGKRRRVDAMSMSAMSKSQDLRSSQSDRMDISEAEQSRNAEKDESEAEFERPPAVKRKLSHPSSPLLPLSAPASPDRQIKFPANKRRKLEAFVSLIFILVNVVLIG